MLCELPQRTVELYIGPRNWTLRARAMRETGMYHVGSGDRYFLVSAASCDSHCGKALMPCANEDSCGSSWRGPKGNVAWAVVLYIFLERLLAVVEVPDFFAGRCPTSQTSIDGLTHVPPHSVVVLREHCKSFSLAKFCSPRPSSL